MFDDHMKNCTEFLIAEYTGEIFKKYSIECAQLSAFRFHPPITSNDLRRSAIETVTSADIRREINRKIYQRLQTAFEERINNWNSVFQTTAKRYIGNAVDDAIDSIRSKLLENPTENIFIQRFELSNDLLKLV